jgi:PGF-pre-PGF domain-containing protein
MRAQGAIVILIAAILAINLAINAYILNMPITPKPQPTIHASSAYLSFCINSPPEVNASHCNATINEDTPYSCLINGTDVETNVTFTNTFITSRNVFTISSQGWINFTPDDPDVGNHTTIITVSDGFNCSNSFTSTEFNFTVIDVNDAPVLTSQIPDRTIALNTNSSMYFISNYFEDQDEDTLTYSIIGGNSILTSINQSNSEAWFYGTVCDVEETFALTATDNINMTTSNEFTISVLCQSNGTTTTIVTGGSGGGGGGGGPVQQEQTTLEGFIATPICTNHVWNKLSKDQEYTWNINKPLISFDKVTFTPAKNLENLKLQVCVLEGAELNSMYTLYQYTGLTTEKHADEDIHSMTITYKVPTLWIKDKEIEINTMTLSKYYDTFWTILKSKTPRETIGEIYYETKWNGFGAYRVAGITRKQVIPENETQPQITKPEQPEELKPTLEEKPSILLETPYKFGLWGQIGILAIVIAVLAILIFRRHKKKHHVVSEELIEETRHVETLSEELKSESKALKKEVRKAPPTTQKGKTSRVGKLEVYDEPVSQAPKRKR